MECWLNRYAREWQSANLPLWNLHHYWTLFVLKWYWEQSKCVWRVRVIFDLTSHAFGVCIFTSDLCIMDTRRSCFLCILLAVYGQWISLFPLSSDQPTPVLPVVIFDLDRLAQRITPLTVMKIANYVLIFLHAHCLYNVHMTLCAVFDLGHNLC